MSLRYRLGTRSPRRHHAEHELAKSAPIHYARHEMTMFLLNEGNA